MAFTLKTIIRFEYFSRPNCITNSFSGSNFFDVFKFSFSNRYFSTLAFDPFLHVGFPDILPLRGSCVYSTVFPFSFNMGIIIFSPRRSLAVHELFVFFPLLVSSLSHFAYTFLATILKSICGPFVFAESGRREKQPAGSTSDSISHALAPMKKFIKLYYNSIRLSTVDGYI